MFGVCFCKVPSTGGFCKKSCKTWDVSMQKCRVFLRFISILVITTIRSMKLFIIKIVKNIVDIE